MKPTQKKDSIKDLLRSAWTTNIEIEAKANRLKALRRFDSTDINNKLSADIKRLYQQVNRITELINNVDNPAMRAVLIKRYIQFQKWPDIAFDLHYSVSGIHKLHKSALKSIENKKCTHFSTTKK